jgi:hypothetical protein
MRMPWGEAKRVGENTPWRLSVTLRVRQLDLPWSSAKTTVSTIARTCAP